MLENILTGEQILLPINLEQFGCRKIHIFYILGFCLFSQQIFEYPLVIKGANGRERYLQNEFIM